MKNIVTFENFNSYLPSGMNESEISVTTNIPSKAEVKLYFTDRPGEERGNIEYIDYGATRLLGSSQISKSGEASKIIGTIISIFNENPEDLFTRVMKEVKKIDKQNYPACLYIVQNSPKIKSMYGMNFRQIGEFMAANCALAADYRDMEGEGFAYAFVKLFKYITYESWKGMIEILDGSSQFIANLEKYLYGLNPQERVSPKLTTQYAERWRPYEKDWVGVAYEPLNDPYTDKPALDPRGKKIYGWDYDDKGKQVYDYND